MANHEAVPQDVPCVVQDQHPDLGRRMHAALASALSLKHVDKAQFWLSAVYAVLTAVDMFV